MKRVATIILSTLLLSGCSLPFVGTRTAGLIVESDPTTNVYIGDQHVGNTRYEDKRIKPGEHTVKLTSLADPSQTYETNINLKPDIIMVINRIFAATPQESMGYVLDLEKITAADTSEMTIITTPTNAIVRLDDQPRGFAPLINMSVNPGEHKITLNASGYRTLEINTEVKPGYRLVVSAELGKSYPLKANDAVASPELATPSATTSQPTPAPSPTPATASASITPSKPYVEVLDTPTGWLRVRSEPNGLVDNEVARVNPGEMYPYLDFNTSGWYQIEYHPGKQGWIASQYGKLFE